MLYILYFSKLLCEMTVDTFNKLVEENDLVMITSPTCSNCRKAKAKLEYNQIPYANVDIKDNPKIYAYISKERKINYVPVLFYKQEFLDNFAKLNEKIYMQDPANPAAGG
ncbi:hypothetical protein H311_00184 [Anncaliia algerae PRA109]|nr:hypothetical protein H311_00184 [Anncaliia algerae PRA109]